MNRHFFLFILLLCTVGTWGACGRAPHIDPPLFTYNTPTLVAESARLHARDAGGFVSAPVANTHSMEPLLHGGDLLVIVRTPYGARLKGHVVGYHPGWDPELFVVHRAVTDTKDGLVMEGDNVGHERTENRYRVTDANYIGEVIAIYRFQP